VGDKNFVYMLPEAHMFVFSTKLPNAADCQNVASVVY